MKLLFPSLIFFISACHLTDKKNNPDVSHIKINLHIQRFEKDLFSLDTTNLSAGLSALHQKYPELCPLFFESIMSFTDSFFVLDKQLQDKMKYFISDSIIINTYNKSQVQYQDFSSIESQIDHSLRFMKYYFPHKQEPNFYTVVSDFGVGNFIFEDAQQKDGIGIGLDFYLGSAIDYKMIDPKNPSFSNYLNRCFNKDHLLKKSWEVWVNDLIGPEPGEQLLDYIIHRGKKIWILTKILPTIPDTVLFEFTPDQLDWCQKNETGIWSYFLSENLLYSTEHKKFTKYINPSPNSPGMPDVAPGQTGSYIGYQIIKAYFEKNPQTQIEDFVRETNAQKILEMARFKPKR
ncbi:MAG: hypothetical protein M3Q56_06345 [Bacteroidota bacterium]|nr:hypothetical protein [Bacteroidota bacterium]